MSWICPNCSNSNGDELLACFVCGMEKPSVVVATGDYSVVEVPEPVSEDNYKVVFSDFDAFKILISDMYKRIMRAFKSIRTKKITSTKTKKLKSDSSSSGDVIAVSETVSSDTTFAEPWPEHSIEFDVTAVRAKGYVRSERKTMSGINGYCFYKSKGPGQFIRLEMLLIQKMAKKV